MQTARLDQAAGGQRDNGDANRSGDSPASRRRGMGIYSSILFAASELLVSYILFTPAAISGKSGQGGMLQALLEGVRTAKEKWEPQNNGFVGSFASCVIIALESDRAFDCACNLALLVATGAILAGSLLSFVTSAMVSPLGSSR